MYAVVIPEEYSKVVARELRSTERRIQAITGLTVVAVAYQLEKGTEKYFELLVQLCNAWEIDVQDLMLKCRKKEVVARRQVAILALLRNFPDIKLQTVATMLAMKDHSTVIYNRDKAIELAEVGDSLLNEILYPVRNIVFKNTTATTTL